MNHPAQLFIDALHVEFHRIQTYALDYRWRIDDKRLPHCVFWYVETGRLHAAVNGNEYGLRPGELLFIPAGGLLSAHSISTDARIVSLNCTVTVAFMPNRPWHELIRFPVYAGPMPPEALSSLRELGELSGRSCIARTLLLHAGLIRMLGQLINRYMPAGSEQTPLAADPRVNSVIAYVTSGLSRVPDVAELAEFAQLSQSHLRKLFLRQVGLSPQQFVLRIKLEQAKRLLAESGERISDIAAGLGFRDPNYFARLFRRHTSLSPKQYRDRNRMWLGAGQSNTEGEQASGANMR